MKSVRRFKLERSRGEGVRTRSGIEGPETVIELGTMHAVQDIKTQKINGLVISRHDNLVEIPLPKAYSRERIPAHRDQILQPETAANWSHLRHIANKIPPYQDDLDVGLLIGNNCVQAIKPRDVIPGKSQDPYAIRTALEWGVIGATKHKVLEPRNKSTANSHRIITRAIASQEVPNLSFIPYNSTKEVLNPLSVRRMFGQDFSEGKKVDKPLSQEDKQFLKKTGDSIHLTEDGHYEMPLPFREDHVES